MHHFYCYIKFAEYNFYCYMKFDTSGSVIKNITFSLAISECGSLMELYTLLVVLGSVFWQNSMINSNVCLTKCSDLFWNTCLLPNP